MLIVDGVFAVSPGWYSIDVHVGAPSHINDDGVRWEPDDINDWRIQARRPAASAAAVALELLCRVFSFLTVKDKLVLFRS